MASTSNQQRSKDMGRKKLKEQNIPADEVSPVIPPCGHQDDVMVDLTGRVLVGKHITDKLMKTLVVGQEGRLRPSSP